MPALALAVMGIALPDSLNPSLIAAALFLALGTHPFRRTLVFTAAAFIVTLVGGLAIALGLGDLILSLVPKVSAHTKWVVMTVVGLLLVAGGAVIWWRRRSLADSEPPSAKPHKDGHSSAAVMGAGIAGVELLTAFPYFAAIAMVVGSAVSAPSKAFLLVLYDVVYTLPLIAIVVVCGTMGERGVRRLAPVGDWIALHWPAVMAPLVALAGAALTVYAVLQLAG